MRTSPGAMWQLRGSGGLVGRHDPGQRKDPPRASQGPSVARHRASRATAMLYVQTCSARAMSWARSAGPRLAPGTNHGLELVTAGLELVEIGEAHCANQLA